MIADAFEYALKNMSHRKLRSMLTVLGIIIGIMSIVSLITISSGLENMIEQQLDQMGRDVILITPKSFGFSDPTQSPTLTTDDAHTVESMGVFEYVMPFLSLSTTVEYGRESRSILVNGIEPVHLRRSFEDSGFGVESGRMLLDGEDNAAVIGYRVANNMFSKKISVQNRILINGRTFTVVGIVEQIGSQPDDEGISISMDSARIVHNKTKAVNAIMLKPKAGLDPNVLVTRIARALEKQRGNENFEVQTAVQLISQISDLLVVVRLVLTGIAAISLVVGGIGIMNSMYTAILERTKEIGLMKAVGASNGNVTFFFVIEAGLLGAVGGIIGTVLGALIALGVDAAAKASGFMLLRIIISPEILVLGVAFASITGAVSGAFPAKEAANLQPAEALR